MAPPRADRRLALCPPLPPKRPRPSLLRALKNRNDLITVRPNLPEDLVGHIFTFLPVKNAVRMGVVASSFKDAWRRSRNLDFDKEISKKFPDRLDYVFLVTRVLAQHVGAEIKSLKLYFNPDGLDYLLQKWIEKCGKKGLQELDVEVCRDVGTYDLPVKCLQVQTLRVLKLKNVYLNLPTNPACLSLLTTIVFRRVDILPNMVAALFSHCTLLHTFDLSKCWGVSCLRIRARKLKSFRVLKVGGCIGIVRVEIDAPTLRSLYYNGVLCHFNVAQHSLPLDEAVLNFASPRGMVSPFTAEKLVSRISSVDVFTTSSTFLEGLSPKLRDGCFRELHYSFRNMKELQLLLHSTSFCNVGDIISFIANCPCLKKLFINLSEHSLKGAGYYWELVQKPLLEKNLSFFKNLKFIKVKGFKFEDEVLHLVRMFLQKSITLETMLLVLPKNDLSKLVIPKDLSTFEELFVPWKLSRSAKVIVSQPMNEKFYDYPKHSKSCY